MKTYEIILDGVSVYGPGPWNRDAMLSPLFVRGMTLEGGHLGEHGPFPVDAPADTTTIGPVEFRVGEAIEIVPPPAPPARTMTHYAFRTQRLTFPERVAWDNSTEPEIVTLRRDFDLAQEIDLDVVAQAMPLLVSKGVVTAERAAEIVS